MGLVTDALGAEMSVVSKMEEEIRKALAKASTELRAGRGTTECTRWFGGVNPDDRKKLGKALGQFRGIVNLVKIKCNYALMADRQRDENAAAYAPDGGWAIYTDLRTAKDQGFKMRINSNFRNLKKYSPDPANEDGQDQFETLVHELSHLIMNTDDVEYNGQKVYGGDSARLLATNDPDKAKKNAENMGFFVEEFRK